METREPQNCLWLGPLHGKEELPSESAISLAANRWQLSFLESLSKRVRIVDVFSHLPHRIFPIGDLIPYDSCKLDPSYSSQIKYLNLPGVRELSLAFGMVTRFVRLGSLPRLLFTYNASFSHGVLGFVASCFGSTWVNIVADGRFSKRATVNVFLSYSYFLDAPITDARKVYFAGGIGEIGTQESRFDDAVEGCLSQVVLYAGSYSKWTGVEDLLDDYISIDSSTVPNLELHLYGFHPTDAHLRLMTERKDIVFHGLVDQQELSFAMSRASVLVNPRPENLDGGDKNFPSKLLAYFEAGKPILSTATPSLGPEFLGHLVLYESKKSFLAGLEKALALSEKGGSSSVSVSARDKALFSWDYGVERVLTAANILR